MEFISIITYYMFALAALVILVFGAALLVLALGLILLVLIAALCLQAYRGLLPLTPLP